MAWHIAERKAWQTTRASNDPEYCERMVKFHRDAVQVLQQLITSGGGF